MAKQLFEKFEGHELTDTMLDDAAKLLTDNYGIWGQDPTNSTNTLKIGKLGSRVKLTKTRLRIQYLPAGASCSYVRVLVDGRLVGNAVLTPWPSALFAIMQKRLWKHRQFSYVKEAKLRGSINSEDTSGVVSSADTKFFVDHTEPLKALARVR
ncbi:hypothetical protein A1O3_06582 [Capronia epimyces CBS 606.96]|uniref:Uncharacterized protein n=1 Tax=Capronia epimyces CBS 606.96 TaxID=1182542 RepID=W9XQD9_9EURO|nr:uncharacterized protein A1O3_06582 [Capronia epimyces CBS 606.96]EXJ82767.1 hypothetical protein A1O3_06582 [Capronia epimyces CBS 606.96]